MPIKNGLQLNFSLVNKLNYIFIFILKFIERDYKIIKEKNGYVIVINLEKLIKILNSSN